MRAFCFWSLFAFVAIQAKAQLVPKPSDEFFVRIMATVIDETTGLTIPYANIRNAKRNKQFSADSLGKFSAVLSDKDTLVISAIGYYNANYHKDPEQPRSYYVTIGLRSKLYELKEVSVITRRSRKLESMLVRPEYKDRNKPRIWLFYTPGLSEPAEPNISNPISYLYENFSRQGRAKQKLRDMIWEKRYREYLSFRYNPGLVSRYTGLEGYYLEEFIRFCPMPDTFVANASDYDIAERIFKCLDDYKETKGW